MNAIEWKKWGRIISLFLFARYPIAHGLSFLMLLGERAKRETHPPLDPNLIYGHVGVLIGVGLAMGFNFRRKQAALIHVVQLIYLAYIVQSNEKLKYKEWLRAKMCLRMLGTAGFFLLYAFFTSPKPRPQYLRRTGETVVGIYAACFLNQLLREPVEREAFLKHALGGTVSLYVLAVMLGACVLCYIPGFFIIDMTHVLLFALWFVTVAIDCRMHYWNKKLGVDYWLQVRLIGDHCAMMLGCVVYLTCTKKVMAVDRPQDDAQESGRDDDDGDDVEIIDQTPLEQPAEHAHPNPENFSETENAPTEQDDKAKKTQ